MPSLHVRALLPHALSLASALSAAALIAAAGALIAAAPVHAQLEPATVLDGPSATILDVDGSAMASDGSGGVLYRVLLGGQAHLFVSRFLGGQWQPGVQVDGGQPFAASFPAIAAGNGGRLLVVWAEPYATINQVTHYELMSAEVDPGASRFGPAIQVDPKDIGDGTAAYPSLAMAPNGQAYVAYRVVSNSLVGSTIVPPRPGDELIDVRVARYNGQGLDWTSLGNVNDHPQLTMRHPSQSNAPAIGVSLAGNAVVAWQEPDASGVARILARRIFGNRVGTAVLDVSATSALGQPIDAEADAPAIAVGTFGEAKIAYRLAGGAGSPYGTPRILFNTLPSEVDPNGAKLQGAQVLAAGSTLGLPSIAIDKRGEFRAAYDSAGSAQLLSGSDFEALGSPLDFGGVGSPQQPAATTATQVLTSINPAGGGVTVWPAAGPSGLPVVQAREDFAGGAMQSGAALGPDQRSGRAAGAGRLGQRRCADRLRPGPAGAPAGDGCGGQGAAEPVHRDGARGLGKREQGIDRLGSAVGGVRRQHLHAAHRRSHKGARAHRPERAHRSARPGRRRAQGAGARHRCPAGSRR